MSSLILGIPSKGRLQEQVTGYLADTGMALTRSAGARDYRGGLAGQPEVEVKLLSSGDIAGALGSGEIHLGVTGEDLLREQLADFNARVVLLTTLGFGFADVVVAVPRAWIDVATMADLDDVCTAFHVRHHRRLRVATKYVGLTRRFFAAHGIGDYRIVESLGATEGAPAAGTAEAIVDITTTGATLAQNELKVLEDGVILKSQAQLAASRKARWDKRALAAAERLTSRIAARELARDSDILRVRIEKKSDAIVAELAMAAGASLLSRPASTQGEHVILTPRGKLMDALAVLRERGIKGAVTVHEADYAFVAANPMMEKLRAALPRSTRQ
jgi:ATP phosphoribosyltransferase